MKRLAVLLVALALLLLALGAPAQAERWKGAGSILTSGGGAVSTTVDRDGDALFAVTTPAGLFTRARPRGEPIQARQLVTSTPAAPRVAGNAAGQAVMAWSDTREPVQSTRVMVALREPGRPFGAAQTVYDEGPEHYVCDRIGFAISDSGEAMVVFTAGEVTSRVCRLMASVRPAGAERFGEPVELDPATASRARPQVAFDAVGNALVAWTRPGSENIDEAPRDLHVVRYLPAAGGFQPVQSLAVPGETVGIYGKAPRLRVAPGGAAILAWGSTSARTTRTVAAIGDTQAGFTPPEVLSGRASAESVDAAVGADGTRAVAWRAGRAGAARVQVARAGPGAETLTSGDTRTLSAKRASQVALAVTDRGRVTVVWSRHLKYPAPAAVEAATASPSRRFERAQVLSTGSQGFPDVPLIATNTNGDQFASWTEQRPGASERTQHWAMAPAATGHFREARQMLRARDVGLVQLYRGARGAMLAVVLRPYIAHRVSWSLFTYGER
jgi:hypothetical protein